MFSSYYFFKITGAVLTAVSSLMLGRKIRNQLQLRRDILTAYKSGLEYSESKIVLDELVLEDCMKECSIRFLEKLPDYNIFSCFVDVLSDGKYTAEEAWTESVKRVSLKGVLNDDDIQLLSELSATLGRADIKHHSEHIKGVVSKLDNLISEADLKLKKDGGLCIKLSVAVSAIIILLLW